jgi:hypothetical protein
MSLEVWLRCQGELAGDTDKYGTVCGALTWDTAVKGIGIRRGAAGTLYAIWGKNVAGWQERSIISNITTTNKNKWYHVVLTYELLATRMKCYVNGELKDNIVYAFLSSGLGFRLGHSMSLNSAESYWYGDVDEVCIYNRLFSAGETRKRFRLGIGSI